MPKVKAFEIPDEPKELYIKLYCQQVGCSTSATRNRAAQSWISLSHSKKKHFLKTCLQKQSIIKAQRIQSTEPFLKQLEGVKFCENDNDTGSECSIDTEATKSEIGNEDSHITNSETECAPQHTPEIDKDTPEIDHSIISNNIENIEQTPKECTLEKSTYDILQSIKDLVDPDEESNDVNETVKEEEIREPALPTVKNSRELFNLLNKDINKTYKDLLAHEKGDYRYLIKKIRTDYIENYMKYLESLNSKELYAHYLKESSN